MEHPTVLLCCAAPTFMLFHYSLFLKFVNNFQIHVRTVSLHFKLSLHFNSVLLMLANEYLINTRFRSQHHHLKSRECFPQLVQVKLQTYAKQVKSRHFSEQIGARRPYFHFFYKFIGIISYKELGQLSWKLIWIYCYLLNGIGLDLQLHNSNLVQKIPNSLFGFSSTTHHLTQRCNCISNC